MKIMTQNRLLGTFVSAALVGSTLSAMPVTTSFTDFESLLLGSVNGQAGWSSTGNYDQAVVDLGGNQVLRLSNKVTSGSFGDMPFAPRPGGNPTGAPAGPLPGTLDASKFAGETGTGALNNRFIASFDFRSVSATVDSGARITISPDKGDGARQGFVALASVGTGVEVSTYDMDAGGDFVGPTVLDTLGFAAWNNLRFEMDFYDGAFNDITRIYLNNTLISTTHSWESYYPAWQSSLHPNGVPVQTLLFRLSGTAASNAQGFYIDNVRLQVDNRTNVPDSVPTAALLLLPVLSLLLYRRR